MADDSVDTDQYRLQVENMAEESLNLLSTLG
jgi:hypothetical protein